MELLTNAPRGTQDVLPSQSDKWQYVERSTLETAALYGFHEIRFPTFEHTELFTRCVGGTTDVVQKEMYTFLDKGGRSITLRPEGTAGTMRAMLQNGLLGDALPVKASYITSCFRYEKPQAGRLREFHQFGIEMTGAAGPEADAQVICVGHAIFRRLGIPTPRLEINSIGCPTCRAEYHKALRAHYEKHKPELCETCLGRLETNPMRLLDCKSPICSEIAKDAPRVTQYLCDDCAQHYKGVKQRLDALGIAYVENPSIVRGLDYYTRTVFEFIAEGIGSQGAVIGGGRYDGLIQLLGGAPTPSIGFAMGIERLLLVLEQQGGAFPPSRPCDFYAGNMGEDAGAAAEKLCEDLRMRGFICETDLMNRSLKAQMKYAGKLPARFSCVIGENELANKRIMIKDMQTGETKELPLDAEAVAAAIKL